MARPDNTGSSSGWPNPRVACRIARARWYFCSASECLLCADSANASLKMLVARSKLVDPSVASCSDTVLRTDLFGQWCFFVCLAWLCKGCRKQIRGGWPMHAGKSLKKMAVSHSYVGAGTSRRKTSRRKDAGTVAEHVCCCIQGPNMLELRGGGGGSQLETPSRKVGLN